MKLTKSRTLTGLILAVLMALPLASILSRVIYVQSNKNAYQSYTSASVEMKSETNSLLVGVNYYYGYTGNTTGQTNNTTAIIPLNTISIELNSQTKYIRFTNSGTLMQYDDNQQNLNLPISVDYCTFSVNENTTLQTQPWYKTYTIVYTEQKLDNVFEYSVSQFIEDNNFGKVDLTSWFTDMFLSENAHNNLYVHFANWYLNYVMLITLMHFLFAVLMWFINYCRRLLDRGMNYDW